MSGAAFQGDDLGYQGSVRLLINRIFPMVYQDLRQLAQSHLARERQDHTLQPTALVHEAYLRLLKEDSITIGGKRHFYGVVSQVMRRILIDHARRKKSRKRGGQEVERRPAHPDSWDGFQRLHDALQVLETIDRLDKQIVEMRFFAGLSEAEIAALLGISERTVRRRFEFARTWLYRELTDDGGCGVRAAAQRVRAV